MSTSHNVCGACADALTDGALCSSCNLELHFHCGGITEAGYRRLGDRKLTWRCPKCKQSGLQSPQARPPSSPEIMSEIRALAIKLIPLESLAEEVKGLRAEMSDLKTQLLEASNTVRKFNEKFDKLDERVKRVEKTQEQFNVLRKEIDTLKIDMNSRDQWSRMNNAEIKGVPQTGNENLFNIIQEIGTKVNYTVAKQQINFITRVPTREKSQPSPIIVSFINRYAKEYFIAASRAANKTKSLTSATLGFTGNNRIFVNDHLTSQNKDLLSKAKKIAKGKNFAYTWVKHARIYLRKDDTSPIVTISSEGDLSKI